MTNANESNFRIRQWKKLFEKKIAPLVDENEWKKRTLNQYFKWLIQGYLKLGMYK